MTFRTNALKVQAFAGALFGVQVGTTTMAQVSADITSNGGLANTLNGYYASSFGSVANATVAASVASNLGLTGDALASGTAYITAQLNGAAAGARGAVISNILDLFAGLASDATFGAAATAWNGKVATANEYTGATNVAIGTVVVASGGVFTLSTNPDVLNTTTVTAANKTTSGNDVIYGIANATLTSDDVIDAGAGDDAINAGATAAGQTLAPVLTSVETVTITHTPADGAALTFSAANTSGLTTINIRNAGAHSAAYTGAASNEVITLSSLPKTATIGIIGGTSGTYDAGGTGTGSQINASFAGALAADTQRVAISAKGQTADLILATAETVEITATGNGTSAANTIGKLTAAAKTLNIKGTGDLTIGSSDLAAAPTIDATATTGVITFTGETAATTTTFRGGSGATSVTTSTTGIVAITTGASGDVVNVAGGNSTGSINTGDGDDEVLVGAQSNVTAADTIVGGAGVDKISVSDATLNATTRTTLALGATGFELLKTTATGTATIDFSAVSVFNTIEIAGAQSSAAAGAGVGAASVTGSNFENTDTLVVSASRAGQIGAAASATTASAGGEGIALTARLDNGSNIATIKFVGDTDINGGVGGVATTTGADTSANGGVGISAGNFETLNIEVSGTKATGTADTVTIRGGVGGASAGGTGDSAGTNGSDVVVNTNGTINITSSLTNTFNTTAAAVHNALDLGTVVASNVTINASTFKGVLTVTAATGNVTITGGDAADVLSSGTGSDVINGGAGADTINAGTGADILTGGTGADIFRFTSTSSYTGGTPSATVFDEITDYAKGSDIIDETGAALTLSTDAPTSTATAGTAAISARGIASFNVADDTFAEMLAAVNAGLAAGTEATNQIAIFEFSGSTYIYIYENDGADAVTAADGLIKLTGVTGITAVDLTTSSGNLILS